MITYKKYYDYEYKTYGESWLKIGRFNRIKCYIEVMLQMYFHIYGTFDDSGQK